MTREPTAHKQQYQLPESPKAPATKKLIQHFDKIWMVLWVVLYAISLLGYYYTSQDLRSSFQNSALTLLIVSVALFVGSIVSSHQMVVPGALVVEGTGAIEDMQDAKNRAFHFVGVLQGAVLASVILFLLQFA